MSEDNRRSAPTGVQDARATYARTTSCADALIPGSGYQHTDIGVIPVDWVPRALGDFCRFSNGYNADKEAYGSGTPFINVLEPITYSHLLREHIPGRVSVSKPIAKLFAVKYGDIVFNRTSETSEEVGLAATYIDTNEVIFGGFVIRGRVVDKSLSPVFLGYALRSPLVRPQIVSRAQGAIRANISQESLRRVIAPLPPSSEQRAIATALSDADALIDALDRLIAKKRAIKQATQQQLLTGQTRLPGFDDEWQPKRLGEHVTFLKNGTNSRAELNDSDGVAYLHYGDIHTTSSSHLDAESASQLPRLPKAKANRLNRLEYGDVVFVDASEDLVGVGKSVEISSVPKGGLVAGLHTIAARFDKAVLADQFKGYLQFHPAFLKTLRSLAAGTKVLATNRRHIAEAELLLPSLDEQTAIATVLADMDAEIEALQHRRDKARQIKQGMMQQLLTGRVRLV